MFIECRTNVVKIFIYLLFIHCVACIMSECIEPLTLLYSSADAACGASATTTLPRNNWKSYAVDLSVVCLWECPLKTGKVACVLCLTAHALWPTLGLWRHTQNTKHFKNIFKMLCLKWFVMVHFKFFFNIFKMLW